MKKLIPLSMILCLLLVGINNVQAQTTEDPWGVTVRTGLAGYNGDLGNQLLNFGNSNIAYGIGLSYYINYNFDIALNITSASLAKANSAHDPVFAQRGTAFEATALSLNLLLRWKFVNTFATNDTRFNPYLTAGLGASIVKFVEGIGPDGTAITPSDLSQGIFKIPVGVGMNVKLTDDLQLNIQALYNRSFSDEAIDHVTDLDEVDHDDWLTTTVGLTIVFGGPEEERGIWQDRMLEGLQGIQEDVNEINDEMDRLIELNEATIDALNALQEELQIPERQMEDLRAKFVRIVNNIQFAFDESYIIEPAEDELNSLANVMNAYENLNITLEAYADERGSVEYNMDLAQRRAQSVKDYLVSHGVSASRITIQVYGETEAIYEPPAQADQPTVWAQNRAVQITLHYVGG